MDFKEGWVLHEGYAFSETAGSLGEPDAALAEAALAAYQNDGIQLVTGDWTDEDRYEFTYQGIDYTGLKYVTIHYEYRVVCTFDPYTGWKVKSHRDETIGMDLDAVGTWVYDDGTGDNKITVIIHEITTETVTFEYEASFDYESFGTTYHHTSSGDGEMITCSMHQYSREPCTFISEDVASGYGRPVNICPDIDRFLLLR